MYKKRLKRRAWSKLKHKLVYDFIKDEGKVR